MPADREAELMAAGGEVIRRIAGRIALLDPDDRVLLSNDSWGGRSWWCTPGGGTEGEENVEAAALREVYESARRGYRP